MAWRDHLLLRIFSGRVGLSELSLVEWDELLVLGRESKLLSKIAFMAEERGELEGLDARVQAHLLTAKVVGRKQREVVRWETRCISRSILDAGCKMVLLKGGAYVAADLEVGAGRLMSDIDIMVSRDKLEEVEGLLMGDGWMQMKADDYDQGYYREWMHELPPMQHRYRGTVIDVHHTILPLTGRLKPDAEKMLADAEPIEEFEGVYRFSLMDIVLHGGAHLFQDGEVRGGLRDLIDLQGLMAMGDEIFWEGLVGRARELDLERPLYYSLRYVRMLLGGEVPAGVIEELKRNVGWGLRLRVMDWMVCRAILPHGGGKHGLLAGVAKEGLYMRSHWLRMPFGMLVKHLVSKGFRRISEGQSNKK